MAKHWARTLAGHTPQDAYQAFEILAQRGELSPDTLGGWRKIIGLRNALVHDYRNIDPEIIRSVIGVIATSCLPSASRARLAGGARLD